MLFCELREIHSSDVNILIDVTSKKFSRSVELSLQILKHISK